VQEVDAAVYGDHREARATLAEAIDAGSYY
jgi:hypothetical protein